MNRFLARLEGGRIVSSQVPERHDQCLVFWRGYIANRDEVLRAAQQAGIVPANTTEGGIFALAYRVWGVTMQARLLGEYAAAIFDERTGVLLLTHDGLGLLPLFYTEEPACLRFGSHLEGLVLETGIGDLDEEYIADYVATGSFTSARTPYAHIKRLTFGHSLVREREQVRVQRTWNLTRSSTVATGDDRAYEERFLAILREGVTAALRATGPVWTELSGGLDSSTVAAIAAGTGASGVEAISLVYRRYSDADELSWMKLIGEHCKMRRHELAGDDLLPFSELPDRFYAEPGAVRIDWNWRRRFEELLRDQGVAAVLTGQGGDLVLYGHGTEPIHLADLARTCRFGTLYSELTRWQAQDPQRRSRLHWLVNYVARPLVSRLRGRTLRPAWLGSAASLVSDDYAAKMAMAERARQPATGRCGSIEEYGFTHNLIGFCSRMANLNQMPDGFEFRHPLLYRPLVEFMLNLPPAQKFHPAMARYLQRRALTGILPEAVRTRGDKTIFDQPYYEGLRLGRVWTQQLTDDPRVVQRGIVDAARWQEAVAQARLGRTARLREFESIAVLEVWLRQLEP